MDFDWKMLVKTVAPTIASAFGTPIAGMATAAILNAILPEGEPRPADPDAYIAKALATADPELMMKIKTAEQTFILDMRRMDVNLAELDNADRKDARAREIAVHDSTPAILAYLLTGGFFAILAFLITKGMPDSSKEVVYLMVGSLGTVWVGSMTYFHGGSAGGTASRTVLGDIVKRLKG